MKMKILTIFNFNICSNIRYIHIVVKQISKTFSFCVTEILYPVNSNSSFPLREPDIHHYTFCFFEFDYFRSKQVEPYSI